MQDIAICIQIRDGNSRLPGKGSMKLEGEPMYVHLMRNVGRCVEFINKHAVKKGAKAKIYFLVPMDEYEYWNDVSDTILRKYDIDVVPGNPENNSDVFYRYEKVFKSFKPSYIVRITGDCPFIPSALINKAINCAQHHKLDYVSNVDLKYRTMPDGYDVEVISDELFLWLIKNIDNGYETDREHVTTYIRRCVPDWARCATITGAFDTSDFKYSIDTKADYEELARRYGAKKIKDDEARKDGLGVYEY